MITPMLALFTHGLQWFWVFLIVILLFGANKLPALARGLGKSLAEFKKAKEDVEREFNKALKEDVAKSDDKPAVADKETPKQS